jgi:hypothetical protein
MRTIRRTILILSLLLPALATPAASGASAGKAPGSTPSVTALLAPQDGAVVDASSPPTFAFEATPGGRFRVEFSSSRSPFIPMVDSGRRTTPGDQFKPSAKQWKEILDLAAVTNTVYWRVVALHMTPDEISAVPVAGFTVRR